MALSTELGQYANVIDILHTGKWQPHAGQIKAGRALFQDNKKTVFIQCGRKWGKTELIMYFLYRWALSNPNASCYYISPFQKQSKEIIWANNRIQNFIPEKHIADTNKTEMRITLHNKSFIKLDGSDNFEAYRGVEPDMVVFEEFKDFRPEFYTAMEPNLAVKNAPLIIIGTPPKQECQFTQLAAECRNDPTKFFIEESSYSNPHISRAWLDKKKDELIARGEWDVWEREYMGRYVKGGADKIFPMIKDSMIKPHHGVIHETRKDIKRLWKCIMADPAGASTFGVLFVGIHPNTRRVYLLDEIYETKQALMTVDNIGKQLIEKRNEIWYPRDDDDWHYGYDEAATWWANEMRDRFDINFMPTRKAYRKKEEGLSLIKDIMLHDLLTISDRCQKTFWELDNYMKDKHGKIPKENDHQIDNIRYTLDAYMYDLNQTIPEEEKVLEPFEKRTLSSDFDDVDNFGRIVHSDVERW